MPSGFWWSGTLVYGEVSQEHCGNRQAVNGAYMWDSSRTDVVHSVAACQGLFNKEECSNQAQLLLRTECRVCHHLFEDDSSYMLQSE